jgi:outer membrane receptor for ferric coprogen and ferric-rhodotorulic acid
MPAPYLSQLRPLTKALILRNSISCPLVTSGIGLVFTLAISAQVQAQEWTLEIPSQPLSQALQDLSSKTGVQLLYSPNDVEGLRSNALNGSFGLDESIRTILKGTGLSYGLNGNTITLQPASENSLQLSATEITGQQLKTTTEGTGSYTTGSMQTATKLPLSIRETPQTVTVITRQRIEDQAMNTLGDALKYTPGITITKWGGEREGFNSRGFQISNLMIDGLPVTYEEAALSTGLLSMYDRLEVVRGVSGLMEGAGSPGGSINLVRKLPTQEFQASITAAAGSWDNYKTEVDVSGPLTPQGGLRGRAVLAYLDKNSFIDYNENQRSLVYGVLEGDIDENTLLRLGVSWSQDNNPGADWNGLGAYMDGSFLPISRSTRMSPSWSYWDKESTTLFIELEHRLSENWASKIAVTHIQSEMDMQGTYLGFTTDHNPYFSLAGGGQAYRYDREQYSIDGMLSGSFSLLGNSHELILGANYRQANNNDHGANTDFTGVIFDPTNWDPSSVPKPSLTSDWNSWYQNVNTEQSGIYMTTRLTLSEQLKLILGGRLDWYESETGHVYPENNSSYKATREFTPYAGLVYQLNDNYSAYISWTQIFNPQNYLTTSGSLLDPQEGSNYEIGLKGEYLEGKLNASLAVFQLDLENLPISLPAASCSAGQTACYAPSGKVRSRGVDIELNGSLTENWQIGAGYTYNYAKEFKESEERYNPHLPLNLFKVFTNYRLPGILQKWKIGGGLNVQSKIYNSNGLKQGGYSTTDLFVSYTASKNLDITMNANNIFDKVYYSSIGTPWGTSFFGDPRNYMLTAKYRF